MASRKDPFSPLARICADAATHGVVPGGVVLCARDGVVRFHAAFGARQLEPTWVEASPETVYDVASLTKAVVTSVLVMRAVERGAFSLDDSVDRHLPEFEGEGKGAVTLRHLLCHASGLPAHRPFYERVPAGPSRRSAIELAVAREPLVGTPGAASLYSDLGFILLGTLLERTAGAPLNVQAEREIFTPLRLPSATTTFVNLDDDSGRLHLLAGAPVAPTERCPLRGRMAAAEVNDLNAFAMGGVAGHAGLFSDALGLSRIAQALCAAWRGEGGDLLASPPVLREFWSPAGIPGSTWRLGWDGPAAQDSQAGVLISRAAVGHLGFTGCSLWIEPARALWIVLLANRVHPVARVDPRFRGFRAAVQDASIAALDSLPRDNFPGVA